MRRRAGTSQKYLVRMETYSKCPLCESLFAKLLIILLLNSRGKQERSISNVHNVLHLLLKQVIVKLISKYAERNFSNVYCVPSL
jgi:hypothetical protein